MAKPTFERCDRSDLASFTRSLHRTDQLALRDALPSCWRAGDAGWPRVVLAWLVIQPHRWKKKRGIRSSLDLVHWTKSRLRRRSSPPPQRFLASTRSGRCSLPWLRTSPAACGPAAVRRPVPGDIPAWPDTRSGMHGGWEGSLPPHARYARPGAVEQRAQPPSLPERCKQYPPARDPRG